LDFRQRRCQVVAGGRIQLVELVQLRVQRSECGFQLFRLGRHIEDSLWASSGERVK